MKFFLCLMALACLTLAVTARPGRRDRDGNRGYQLPTAERREERFERTIADLTSDVQTAARDIFNDIEDILGDVTSLDELDEDDLTEYNGLKQQLKDTIDDGKFQQSIAFLSGDSLERALALKTQIDALIGTGSPHDLSDSDGELYEQYRDRLKALQRESRFEEKVSQLPSASQDTARDLHQQIQTLVADGTPCELSEEDRSTFDSLRQQLADLFGENAPRDPKCERNSGERSGAGGNRRDRNRSRNGSSSDDSNDDSTEDSEEEPRRRSRGGRPRN